MGTLFYGDNPLPIEVQDLALAHLKAVVVTKLRRHESFMLSWRHSPSDPGFTSTVWFHPAIAMRFVFDEPERPPLNPIQIQALATAATTSVGIQLVPQDESGVLTIRVTPGP